MARQPAQPGLARGRRPVRTRCCRSSRPTGPRCTTSCAAARRGRRGAAADGRERVLIGELYLPIERLMAYYGSRRSTCRPNFHLLSTRVAGRRRSARWSTPTRRRCRTARGRTGCWATTTAAAHRQPRRRRAGARRRRAAADAARHADALLRRRARHERRGGAARARAGPVGADVPGQGLGRDPQRTPMQWDAGPNAGLLHGRSAAVAAARRRRRRTQRRRPARRPATRCSRCTASCCACAAPSRRWRPASTAPSAAEGGASPTSAATTSSGAQPFRRARRYRGPGRRAARHRPRARERETLRGGLRLAGGEAVIVRTSCGA